MGTVDLPPKSEGCVGEPKDRGCVGGVELPNGEGWVEAAGEPSEDKPNAGFGGREDAPLTEKPGFVFSSPRPIDCMDEANGLELAL